MLKGIKVLLQHYYKTLVLHLLELNKRKSSQSYFHTSISCLVNMKCLMGFSKQAQYLNIAHK